MKKFHSYYWLLLAFITIYILELTFIPAQATSTTRFGISSATAKLLSLSVTLPYMLIWYTAFYGFIKVKQYASLRTATSDGRAMEIISNGLMVVACSLPLSAVLSSLRTYTAHEHPQFIEETTIGYNYISLVFTLVGLWLISHGANRLIKTLQKKPYSFYQAVLSALFTAFCIIYTYVTLNDAGNQQIGSTSGTGAYYLPDFLIFSTMVVPYLCVWFLGFRSAYHIQLYRTNTPGVLYKQALGYLSGGVVFVVFALIVLRLLISLSSFLNSLSLYYLLVSVYALLVVIGFGFVLIAIGAKKLKKIEEV